MCKELILPQILNENNLLRNDFHFSEFFFLLNVTQRDYQGVLICEEEMATIFIRMVFIISGVQKWFNMSQKI